MVKTYESWIPRSPNLDKVTVTFDKLNITDLFHQMQGAYSVHFWLSKNKDYIIQIYKYKYTERLFLGVLKEHLFLFFLKNNFSQKISTFTSTGRALYIKTDTTLYYLQYTTIEGRIS